MRQQLRLCSGIETETFTSYIRNLGYDKSAFRLLGQKISVERKDLKTRDFDVFSNGFTPRLHLLKVSYPMNVMGVLCDKQSAFFIINFQQ